MTSLRPTPEQERWMHVASRSDLKRETPWLAGRIGGWVAMTALTRCAFFVLGLFAAGSVGTLFFLLHVPGFLLVAGLVLIGVAELLIVKRRSFRGGVEEALELAGLLMIAVDTLDLHSGTSGIRLLSLITLMLLVAGLRLLNPGFMVLSVLASSATLDFTLQHYFGSALPGAAFASIYCMGVAMLMLSIHGLEFRRPCYDQAIAWLIVTMPLAAYVWFELQNEFGTSIGLLWDAPFIRGLPALALVVFALTALMTGIRRRSHAPILAFMVCVGCVAFELRHLTTLSLQAKLIGWGSLALLLTMGLDRYLRTSRQGITSHRFIQGTGSLGLLELAGISALAPAPVHRPDAQFKGGGGTFGGGGAGSEY